MYSIKEHLLNKIRSYLENENIFIDVSRSPIKDFDYSTNLLYIAKNIKEEEFIDYLKSDEIVDNVQVINKFVNIRLNRKLAFRRILDSYISDGWKGYDLGKGKRVLIEFVSANPTGPLNAVNGRSATFGSVFSNVLNYFNYQVHKEYYVNDVGEQVEKLVDSFIERLKQARGEEYQIPEGGYQGEYLKDLAEKFLNSSNYTQERERIKQFLISYFVEEHRNTLSGFGVVFDNWFRQSSLNLLEKTFKDLKDKGLLYEKDGAIYFASTIFGDDKDRVVKKTRGRVEYTYFAYDIEYIRNKFERGFDQIITILGPDHHGYVNRLIAATNALGYNDHRIIILQIVNILEKDKALKMSKRKGVLVLLDELLNKVRPEFLRYFFISRLKDSPLDLDLDLINRMTLDNPLYYIFYVYARINGIIRNYSRSLPGLTAGIDAEIDDDEFSLFLAAQEFRDSVLSAINDPYYLTLWAHSFAKSFHRFYNSNKVICADELGMEKEKLRIILILFSKGVLERWAKLLSIELPERM